jgi:hypothetical protein
LATKKGPEALELLHWLKEPETGKINSSPILRVLHYQVFIFGIFISCFTNKKWWPQFKTSLTFRWVWFSCLFDYSIEPWLLVRRIMNHIH